MSQDAPGLLLGAGRTADVYALDQDRVLRRYRVPRDAQAEAEKMRFLAEAGFPVPAVYDADKTCRGPVVIDWTGAQAGAGGADVAMAYLIMATSETDLLPAPLRLAITGLRAVLFRYFLASVQDDPSPYLAAAAKARMADHHVRPRELTRLRRAAARADRTRSGRSTEGTG